MSEQRKRQLGLSDTHALMLDETSRRAKAGKMIAVIEHFLGAPDLSGRRILDVGCSGGIVADELRSRGGDVIGIDIDVPGLEKARDAFSPAVSFLCGDSQALPFADGTIDVVLCNHVYEHVVSPAALFPELRRVLAPGGLLYLGLGNRWGVVEPHYRLPFLSWLPRRLAHRYVRASGRAPSYHEQFTGWYGLRALCRDLTVWDYTFTLMAQPDRFGAGDAIPGWLGRVPAPLLRVLGPIVPTYIWVATAAPSQPAGPATRLPPRLVPT